MKTITQDNLFKALAIFIEAMRPYIVSKLMSSTYTFTFQFLADR